MILTDLNVHHIRSISSAKLKLHPRYNVFYGANGSGKTSLLEAIYLLGTGFSFRTRESASLITFNEPSLTVFGCTDSDQTVSIQKSMAGVTLVRIDQQPCNRSSDLAHFLPCQIFYQDIFQIIDEGPSTRRSLLDWGLFHVKQSYHSLWKDYRRVIKQRNALLRQKASQQHLLPWNNQVVELSYELDRLRTEYFNDWTQVFQKFLSQLTDVPCNISYYKGWDKKKAGKDLAAILTEQLASDIQAQYTHSGAHQADILFEVSDLKAKQKLSRGQQKIILIALKLAQAQLIQKPCIYLFDDITAELDANHLQRFINCLDGVSGQFFLTAIESDQFSKFITKQDVACFTIREGCFT